MQRKDTKTIRIGVKHTKTCMARLTQKPSQCYPDACDSGTTTGRWAYEKQIGEGGFGIVWRAKDVKTDARVALKLIKTRRTQDVLLASKEVRHTKRFENLTYPATGHTLFVKYLEDCTGFEAYDDEDALSTWAEGYVWNKLRCDAVMRSKPYIVMELLFGHTVSGLLFRNALPQEDRVRIIHQSAVALCYLWHHRCVHRDFRVQNVMWRDGQLKVIDFGLCLPDAHPKYADSTNPLFRTYWRHDSYWIPPEVKQKRPVCNFYKRAPASFDVYGLGVMALELMLDRGGRALLQTKSEKQSKNASVERLVPHEAFRCNHITEEQIKNLALEPTFFQRLVSTRPDERPSAKAVLHFMDQRLPEGFGAPSQHFCVDSGDVRTVSSIVPHSVVHAVPAESKEKSSRPAQYVDPHETVPSLLAPPPPVTVAVSHLCSDARHLSTVPPHVASTKGATRHPCGTSVLSLAAEATHEEKPTRAQQSSSKPRAQSKGSANRVMESQTCLHAPCARASRSRPLRNPNARIFHTAPVAKCQDSFLHNSDARIFHSAPVAKSSSSARHFTRAQRTAALALAKTKCKAQYPRLARAPLFVPHDGPGYPPSTQAVEPPPCREVLQQCLGSVWMRTRAGLPPHGVSKFSMRTQNAPRLRDDSAHIVTRELATVNTFATATTAKSAFFVTTPRDHVPAYSRSENAHLQIPPKRGSPETLSTIASASNLHPLDARTRASVESMSTDVNGSKQHSADAQKLSSPQQRTECTDSGCITGRHSVLLSAAPRTRSTCHQPRPISGDPTRRAAPPSALSSWSHDRTPSAQTSPVELSASAYRLAETQVSSPDPCTTPSGRTHDPSSAQKLPVSPVAAPRDRACSRPRLRAPSAAQTSAASCVRTDDPPRLRTMRGNVCLTASSGNVHLFSHMRANSFTPTAASPDRTQSHPSGAREMHTVSSQLPDAPPHTPLSVAAALGARRDACTHSPGANKMRGVSCRASTDDTNLSAFEKKLGEYLDLNRVESMITLATLVQHFLRDVDLRKEYVQSMLKMCDTEPPNVFRLLCMIDATILESRTMASTADYRDVHRDFAPAMKTFLDLAGKTYSDASPLSNKICDRIQRFINAWCTQKVFTPQELVGTHASHSLDAEFVTRRCEQNAEYDALSSSSGVVRKRLRTCEKSPIVEEATPKVRCRSQTKSVKSAMESPRRCEVATSRHVRAYKCRSRSRRYGRHRRSRPELAPGDHHRDSRCRPLPHDHDRCPLPERLSRPPSPAVYGARRTCTLPPTPTLPTSRSPLPRSCAATRCASRPMSPSDTHLAVSRHRPHNAFQSPFAPDAVSRSNGEPTTGAHGRTVTSTSTARVVLPPRDAVRVQSRSMASSRRSSASRCGTCGETLHGNESSNWSSTSRSSSRTTCSKSCCRFLLTPKKDEIQKE